MGRRLSMGSVYVVGHRGAAGLEPENTLRSFRRAIEWGVNYVECDVHLTRDSELVVIHDDTVDRTTEGKGRVADLTFAELRRLDAGKGERVPALREVLEIVKGRAGILIELKGPGTEGATLRLLREMGMEREVIVTSFHPERLARVWRLWSDLRTCVLFGDPPPDAVERTLQVCASAMGVYYQRLTVDLVQAAHDAGLEVRAWNPDTVLEMEAVLRLGVDGIGTNRPDLLLTLLGRQRERSAGMRSARAC